MKTKLIYTAIVTLFFIGCKQKTEPKLSESSQTGNEKRIVDTSKIIDASKDAEYMVDTYSSGLFFIQAAEIAKQKAMNKQVKLIAEIVAQRHKKINNEINELASEKKLSLPSRLNLEQMTKIQVLEKEDPSNIEKEFLKQMESEHKQDIELFEKISKESEDNDISALAVYCLSELQTQYDQLVNVKDKLNL